MLAAGCGEAHAGAYGVLVAGPGELLAVDTPSRAGWANTWDHDAKLNPWREAAGWVADLLPHLEELARVSMPEGCVRSEFRHDAGLVVQQLIRALAELAGVRWDVDGRGGTPRAEAAAAITLLRLVAQAPALDVGRLAHELPGVEVALRTAAEAWAAAQAVEQTIVDAQQVPARKDAWQRQDPGEVARCRGEVAQVEAAKAEAAAKAPRVRLIVSVLPPPIRWAEGDAP